MQIDRETLREQYRSMADEELLAREPGELTDLARTCYDAEMARPELTVSREFSPHEIPVRGV